MWQYNYSDELYHYGVPGMKWGQRRAIKKQEKADAKARYNQAKVDKKVAHDAYKSNKSSEAAKQKVVKADQEYRDAKAVYKDKTKTGRRAVKALIGITAVTAGTVAAGKRIFDAADTMQVLMMPWQALGEVANMANK